MSTAIDGFQSNPWEDELRIRNDISPHGNTNALSRKRDISLREKLDQDDKIQSFRQLQKFIRREVVDVGSYVDVHNNVDDFQTGEEHSRFQETEDDDSLEDRHTGEEFDGNTFNHKKGSKHTVIQKMNSLIYGQVVTSGIIIFLSHPFPF